MTFHVHIYNVGKTPETAFSIIGHEIPIEKLILLNNDKEEYKLVEDEIRKGFEPFPIEVETVIIDPWDYYNVFNKVIESYHKECEEHGDVRFHINFTKGTRIVVSAVCNAAYSIEADLYYVQEGQYSKSGKDTLIYIDIENINELMELKARKKPLEIFKKFSDRKPKMTKDLLIGGMSVSTLSFHTSYLQKLGLIERKGSVRNTEWILTEKGKNVMNRL